MSSNPGVVVQNLREFTLQIRDAKGNIQGTGILISESGEIVTCAHVVEVVLDKPVSEITNGEEVPVYFPQVREQDKKTQFATLKAWFDRYDDDVVLLQLKNPLPSAKLTPAKLGSAKGSIDHPFRTYGYPRLGIYDSARADGIILGDVEPPEGRIVQVDPIMLQSEGITHGMSGAAVLDTERNLVVGMITEGWMPDQEQLHFRDTVWAIDFRILELDPFLIPLEDFPLPKAAAPMPMVDPSTMAKVRARASSSNTAFHGAPPPIEKWTSWISLVRNLSDDWTNSEHRVSVLEGYSHRKGSLIRRWIELLRSDQAQTQPHGIFWWNFVEKPNVQELFEEALNFMKIKPEQIPSGSTYVQVVGSMLGVGRYLFVLDNLEVIQDQRGDTAGELRNEDLQEFLKYFVGLEHESLCLITSRVQVIDLIAYATANNYQFLSQVGPVRGVSNDEAADKDLLGFEPYVHALVALVESRHTIPPLTIGIYGSWGIGKSTLLEHIKKEVEKRQAEQLKTKRWKVKDFITTLKKKISPKKHINETESTDPPHVYVVGFNAWEYSSTELIWAGLVRKIMDWVEKKYWYSPSLFLNRFWRNVKHQWQQERPKLIIVIAVLLALVLFAWWQFDLDTQLIIRLFLALGVSGLAKLLFDTFSTPLSGWFMALLKRNEYGQHITYMADIRADLEYLEKRLHKRSGRVLVLIDDLDRCEPEKAVEMLQAVKLLLNFESFIICLGVDARILTRAVEHYYKNLFEQANVSGYEYLDKVIQIPFRIPQPNPDQIKTFLEEQLGTSELQDPEEVTDNRLSENGVTHPIAQTPPSEEQPSSQQMPFQETSLPRTDNQGLQEDSSHIDEAEQLSSPIEDSSEIGEFSSEELRAFQDLAYYLQPNPRHLKRLINTYRLVRAVASFKGEQVVMRKPVATIRWLVICAQWPYTSYLMLWLFDEIQKIHREENQPAPSIDNALLQLFEWVKAENLANDILNKEALHDRELDVLHALLEYPLETLNWKELEIIKQYTVNFNPAIEAEIQLGRSGELRTALEETIQKILNQISTTYQGELPPQINLESLPITLPKGLAPQPDEDMRRAPALIEEWVGREDLLKQLSADFADSDTRISGLVGFGGEGKSSLARKWIDSVRADGVFWWGFYDNREVEQFFEAALTYLAGPEPTAQVTSTSVRAGIIAQLLREKRVIFVLDGFEVMQHQEGDSYGQIASNDLLEFLGYFAGLEHNSFCLITTRTPLMEMMKYTSYQHRDVNRLSEADGRDLLCKQGVEGTDEELTQFVNTWDGHALTISLLGAYVGEKLSGDLARLDETPLAEEGRYERVHRVLRRYDEYLGEAEQAFLTLVSAFRTPVKESAFPTVFRMASPPGPLSASREGENLPLNAPIAALDDFQFEEMLVRLCGYRILRYDPAQQHYTTHPLIREHYAGRFKEAAEAQKQQSHMAIKEHYLELAGDTPYYPTLDDLAPLIEGVHHACRARAYDEAWEIYLERIYQGSRYVLPNQLGAWETDLALNKEFFPDGDISREPQVSQAWIKSWILNEVGLCLMSLGRLAEAVPPYERHNQIQLDLKDWRNTSGGYQNLAELHAHLGALAASAQFAQDALDLARRMEPGLERQQMERNSLSLLGWVAHLRGDLALAGKAFWEAEALERAADTAPKYLYSVRGIFHVEYLRRVGDADYARRVTEANLEICEQNRWPKDISQCHRMLGDLDTDAGQYGSARGHYDAALRIARGITRRDMLIEALLELGRFLARHPQPGESARPYLDEALDYCLESGYRRYEADCRVAMAWLHQSEGRPEDARAEALRAKAMSEEMGYHWGVVDAEEVLGEL